MLSKYLDIISVMTYDYHGHWDKKTGHVAPMYYHPSDEVAFFNTVSWYFKTLITEKNYAYLILICSGI